MPDMTFYKHLADCTNRQKFIRVPRVDNVNPTTNRPANVTAASVGEDIWVASGIARRLGRAECVFERETRGPSVNDGLG